MDKKVSNKDISYTKDFKVKLVKEMEHLEKFPRYFCNEIKDYIKYYNNYRYQWVLEEMTPVKYRNHLLVSLV